MKKVIYGVVICLALIGCESHKKSHLTGHITRYTVSKHDTGAAGTGNAVDSKDEPLMYMYVFHSIDERTNRPVYMYQYSGAPSYKMAGSNWSYSKVNPAEVKNPNNPEEKEYNDPENQGKEEMEVEGDIEAEMDADQADNETANDNANESADNADNSADATGDATGDAGGGDGGGGDGGGGGD